MWEFRMGVRPDLGLFGAGMNSAEWFSDT